MTDYIQVSTTAADRETAMELLRSAVGRHLAASGQVIGPVASMFWHQGEAGEGEEWQVWLRTTADRYPDLEAHLVSTHRWDNPEVTAWPMLTGSKPYLEWLGRETRAQDAR